MNANARVRVIGGIAGLSVAFAGARAGIVNTTIQRPTLDRWMYPFAASAGTEGSVPTFAAVLEPNFDDRDAQFLIGWDTGSLVPAGLALGSYKIDSIRVRVSISVDNQARYDPAPESYRMVLPTTDSQYLPDPTPGKPVELFAAGYRNGLTALTFQELSPFTTGAPFPAEGVRSVFAAALDGQGGVTDISRHVRQRFDATPLAIGTTASVQPGQFMPAGTTLTLEMELCSPGARQYMQQAFAQGRLMLVITSLDPATGGPGGGTGTPTYPAFYAKDSIVATALGLEPKLEISMRYGPIADMDGDEGVTIDDLLLYLQAFFDGSVNADMNGDCGVTIEDLFIYLEAFYG